VHVLKMKFDDDEISALLEASDYDRLLKLSESRGGVIRLLISMSCERTEVRSWRAMRAIGRISAAMPDDRARGIIQRLLWMMRDESGSGAWSAGMIIGETIRAKPAAFEDIVPVVISFHEEPLLRPGALWAFWRIGGVRPDLVVPFEHVPVSYIGSEDPTERGLSILALKSLGSKRHLPLIRKGLNDTASFWYFDGDALIQKPIGSLASEAIEALKG
jgi:hypothetical protein